MDQENNKDEADNNAAKDLVKSQSSEKKGPNSLKAKSDIAKSAAKNFIKTRKASATCEAQKGKKKKRAVSEGSKEAEENAKRLNVREENQQKSDATTSTELEEKSKQIQKNPENSCVSDGGDKSVKPNDSPNEGRREEEPGVSKENRKNEEKQKGKQKIKQNERKEQYKNSEMNNKNKEERLGTEKKEENRKKEKIGGLIFMCNAKTKPDCFRYRVMGVSSSKKDLVLGIRRGLKLFLYDYDLKLMYGIYTASSAGGMKLEPKAFGGAFPAQVRFSVHADCFPLAESIFKKAIKENYNEKNKFKTELTARQVRKLTELFRPVTVQPTALPIRSPSRAVARVHERPENREARDRGREARPPLDREASARGPYANINARSYDLLSRERDQRIAYGGLGSGRREDGRDLYLNEKEYRAYGLQGERGNLNLQHHAAPALSPYQRDYGERLLRQPDTLYRESVPLQRDLNRSDPLYSTERGHRTYDVGASTLDNPYHNRYGASLVDSYLPRPIGDRRMIDTDDLRRRESIEMDKLCSRYASGALADYNQMRHHQIVRPEATPASVSSRYSFGGASMSYR